MVHRYRRHESRTHNVQLLQFVVNLRLAAAVFFSLIEDFAKLPCLLIDLLPGGN